MCLICHSKFILKMGWILLLTSIWLLVPSRSLLVPDRKAQLKKAQLLHLRGSGRQAFSLSINWIQPIVRCLNANRSPMLLSVFISSNGLHAFWTLSISSIDSHLIRLNNTCFIRNKSCRLAINCLIYIAEVSLLS